MTFCVSSAVLIVAGSLRSAASFISCLNSLMIQLGLGLGLGLGFGLNKVRVRVP